ncbi:unnamed protein product [Plutella xylostella]|uniref:(diamondback moth) hypothetical protein n=1 Tax=Plutella xylostella TaxID=51655 RepID=A0A8S4GFE7_PLUXY|nr:unnamed protein product [Plutella xylostella]
MAANAAIIAIHIIFIITLTHQSERKEEGYLRKVKDACYLRGEALSCVKYKAIKLAKNAIFPKVTNETIRASHMISFVPLDEETIRKFDAQDVSLDVSEGRGLLSEWSELTKYIVKVVKDFFKTKGLRVALPDGARAIEDDVEEEGRGKRKKLALVIPFLTLMAVLKAKLLLLPILLAVLLIKKLLLAAALLIPSLLHTLKACKFYAMWCGPTTSSLLFGLMAIKYIHSNAAWNIRYLVEKHPKEPENTLTGNENVPLRKLPNC